MHLYYIQIYFSINIITHIDVAHSVARKLHYGKDYQVVYHSFDSLSFALE